MGNEAYSELDSQSKKKLMWDWEYGPKKNFKHTDAETKKWILAVPGFRGPTRKPANDLDGLQPGAIFLKTWVFCLISSSQLMIVAPKSKQSSRKFVHKLLV